jgi:hypothetical protein
MSSLIVVFVAPPPIGTLSITLDRRMVLALLLLLPLSSVRRICVEFVVMLGMMYLGRGHYKQLPFEKLYTNTFKIIVSS